MLFSEAKKRRPIHINLISLIDVFLFLVIFYMLTAHWLKTNSISLSLAPHKNSTVDASSESDGKISAEKNGFILKLMPNQRIKIGEGEIITLPELEKFLLTKKPIAWIRISLTHDTNIQDLTNILALSQRLGISSTTLEREIIE